MSAEKTFGLVGYPLGHSFSRGFFTEKFADEGINARYLNFELKNIDEFPALVESQPQLQGLNVTIPYKQQVIPYLDTLSPEAESIGAVNVIKPERDASGRIVRLVGHNSDVIGFVESIRPLIQPHHRKALVLGTGGASKAVCHGLRSLGVEPVLVSRTPASGRLTYSDLSAEVMAEHTVVVNTTPVGMHPHVDECPDIPYSMLTPSHLCFDVVYNPETTLFLARAAEAGAATKNGLEMLHLQAIGAWKIWNE